MDSCCSEVRQCGDESAEAGRGPGQLDWYRFAARFVTAKRVLDVGCGLGHGLPILRSAASAVTGQDLDWRLAAQGVRIMDVQDIPDKSYDVVISIDVVEHVFDPEGFVRQLTRIAREGVFLTTPNWTASRCQWPFHLREYTPNEWYMLLSPLGRVTLFKGTSSGSFVVPIRHESTYFLFNQMRNVLATSLPTRCLNRLLPREWRIHSHNAAWIEV